MELSTTIQIARDELAENTVSGITLLVPMTNDVDKVGKIFELDEMGSVMWNLCKEHGTVGEVKTALLAQMQRDEIAHDEAEVEKDLIEFVGKLETLGALKTES